MKISIKFADGQMTPMEVPVLRAGIGEPFSNRPVGLAKGGVRLLELRRRAPRNWSRLFIPLEIYPVRAANTI